MPKCSENCSEILDHKLQLQLYDLYGVPVPNTQFWIKIKILIEGHKVTLQLPTINFQTGPYANNPNEPPVPVPPFIPGGYLYTSDGYLPKCICPQDVVNRSWLAATDNGVNQSFSFTQDADTLPKPITGYILQVTSAGGLVVQGAGTFGNIIPAGNQTLLPTTISYLVEPVSTLKKNVVISDGPTNITQFRSEGPFNPLSEGLRDSHVNDAYNGLAAWTWSDNSMVRDKTNNVLNQMVAIGYVNDKGKLKVNAPVQLTDLQPPFSSIQDNAVAINRALPNIVVVSYSLQNYSVQDSHFGQVISTCRAVSFDGGKTWPPPFDGITPQPFNGPTLVQPSGNNGLGDNPGVQSDKFGNIWYMATNLFDPTGTIFINQPYIMVSTDGGVNYKVVYIFPFPVTDYFYDFPQYCFGGDGLGNYGLHFTADYNNLNPLTGEGSGDLSLFVGFFPITGPGQYDPSAPATSNLTDFTNANGTPVIAAAEDGRVWLYGALNLPNFAAPESNISSRRIIYKSPGPINQNYAGPWDFAISNNLNQAFFITNADSEPIFGYFLVPRSIVYDEKRQALYAIHAANSPDFSQNMRLYFAISRDNGQTWSNVIDISNSSFANRGFQTMALDSKTGNLIFGWYDGRNDTTYQSVEYYGAVITSEKLTELVKKIPLSNPIYNLPPANATLTIKKPLTVGQIELRKKLITRKYKWPSHKNNKVINK